MLKVNKNSVIAVTLGRHISGSVLVYDDCKASHLYNHNKDVVYNLAGMTHTPTISNGTCAVINPHIVICVDKNHIDAVDKWWVDNIADLWPDSVAMADTDIDAVCAKTLAAFYKSLGVSVC
jgi:hypothetical protein